MKFLILITLLVLVSCGGKNTSNIKLAKAKALMATPYVTQCANVCYIVTIEKFETKLGGDWVLFERVRSDDSSVFNYVAYNLQHFDLDGNEMLPEDGETSITRGYQIVDLGNGNYESKEIDFLVNRKSAHSLQAYGSFYPDDYIPSVDDGVYLRAYDVLDSWNSSLGTSSVGIPLSELGLDIGLSPNPFIFDESSESKKDLETLASNIEIAELVQYGLSTKAAKMVKTLAKTAGKRALSKREKDMFAKELTGMTFDEAAEQMVEDYDGLIEKAAELNETSPEAIKELIGKIL